MNIFLKFNNIIHIKFRLSNTYCGAKYRKTFNRFYFSNIETLEIDIIIT